MQFNEYAGELVMSQPKCTCHSSGFMRETSFLDQAIVDIEEASANRTNAAESEIRLGNIPAYLCSAGLAVLTGNKQQNMILAANLIHQRIFQLGVGCGVFCEDAKAFVTGQLSLISMVGINKLYTGEIGSDDWGYISHAIDRLKDSSLYLGVLPSSLELLKEDIRHYSAKCTDEDSNMDYAIFVLDLPRLYGEQMPFDKLLHELRTLSVEIDRPIIVIHDACGQDAPIELESIFAYADVFHTLRKLTAEQANLSILIKARSLLDEFNLIFAPEKLTVKLPEGAISNDQ